MMFEQIKKFLGVFIKAKYGVCFRCNKADYLHPFKTNMGQTFNLCPSCRQILGKYSGVLKNCKKTSTVKYIMKKQSWTPIKKNIAAGGENLVDYSIVDNENGGETWKQ